MYFIGVDLGGTNIVTALVNEKGEVFKKDKRPTEAIQGPGRVIGNMKNSIYAICSDISLSEVKGIGLGIPGLVDINKGVCIFSGNLGWQKVRIAGDFREEFGVPVFMDNDVRAATLGEQYFGAGKGIANFICITLGTGVGSGIVISEKIYRGPTCSAGEIGHTTIFKDGPYCNCGNRGCLELYASATGIARRAREYIIAGHYTVMTEMVKGDLSKITAETVSIACDMGDNLAALIIEETAEILGIGIANYINILDPEMVIIGGGVSLAGDKLFSPLKKVVSKRTMKNMGEKVNIVQAKLRDEAGMIGAAVLAMEGLGII